jgi:hypothetical protein
MPYLGRSGYGYRLFSLVTPGGAVSGNGSGSGKQIIAVSPGNATNRPAGRDEVMNVAIPGPRLVNPIYLFASVLSTRSSRGRNHVALIVR